MAEEFQIGSGNWWDNSPRNRRFDGGSSTSSLADPTLQMMGLGLSSQTMDWNQQTNSLVRVGKAESSFRHSGTDFQQETVGMESSQEQWSQKIYDRRFQLDQPQFTSHICSGGDSVVTTSFQVDPVSYGSSSIMLQGILLGSDQNQQQQQQQQQPISYPYPPITTNQYPQFLRSSPPKQQQQPQSQLQLSNNNAPFWNAPVPNDVRSTFFPSFPAPTLEEKTKNASEVQDLGPMTKKSSSEPSNKRSRNETPSPLPASKVRKEKMGDRITTLQQLVSPFGKTDTASVLSEAIEYIKFLHEQVHVLSTPYMKSGASIQHQQNYDKPKDYEGQREDLRSRGLCLVPVSSTFPVTHETTVDFWTPTFGGTFK